MTKLFISHSSSDDAFVRDLQTALALHGQDVWNDSRELRGGDSLSPEIQQAIKGASGFTVVVSSEALQSEWVSDELDFAIELQKERGKEKFPVFPLLLNGAKLGAFKKHFGGEPKHIEVTSEPNGAAAAVDPILIALGKRLPADRPPSVRPPAEPIEELVLELSDLKFFEKDGVRRPSAHARLVYQPAIVGQREVASEHTWRLVAPLGPIEAEELRWYLEKYAIWPSDYFRDRAKAVEQNLVKWGQDLHAAALPVAHVANVMQAWARVDGDSGRRFSVLVNNDKEDGAPKGEVQAAQEASTLLLSLPWELLHDGQAFLFQGAKPTRVRRRLPNTKAFDVAVVAAPVRILLVTARPEDDACGYIDHRASALPLVQAMEALGGLVHLHVLSPPTLSALREELDRARNRKEPYHVVHFDGHGVYDRRVGLGGLCFEDPQTLEELEKRRHITVYTNELGPLLRDYRIPLVFLEACQTAQAERASESVASELLKVGVGSVVAMSHSVLVETAQRFVQAFYAALAQGARVGKAMLEGQRALKDDRFRGRIFGAGELRLDDWFVPVLLQEKNDPQLFYGLPAHRTQSDIKTALQARMGKLPPEPDTGFVGRSRELLKLQRLLRHQPYAVVRGQGGEGKTTLIAEFARWMVRSQQIFRAAFVSVESHSSWTSVLDALGQQLVPGYSVATFENLDKALQPIERALHDHPTLLVIDNMESILLPPYVERAEALSEDASRELTAILKLCQRLNAQGDTRLAFTSREELPAPFNSDKHRIELHQLSKDDAVKLVERALNQEGAGAGAAGQATAEAIEQLVDSVHCHARTLALLGPSLRERGVNATREALVELMADMERQFPGQREKSVYASVELSLRRLSPENQQRARALGVFHGSADLDVLRAMMEWEKTDVASLAAELVQTGLATPNDYNHLTLNPALCPYLRARLSESEHEELEARWTEAMRRYVEFLAQQRFQNVEMASKLTLLELQNLFALLDHVQAAGDPDATIALATSLYGLLQNLGKPRLVERVGKARDTAEATLGETWNHAQFEAQRTRIEQQLGSGRLREAFEGAQDLLRRARAAGENAYPGADYDLAGACFMLGRVLHRARGADQALRLLNEAQDRFEAVERDRPGRGAERAASVCLSERGDCLRDLGRLDEAAAAYEERIRAAEKLGDIRGVAAVKLQLGTVRLRQRRYKEALQACEEAREKFAALGEPGTVAVAWHLIGMVCQEAGQAEAAEEDYRQALAIRVQLGDVTGQAGTLGQLGNLYNVCNRPEQAAAFYRQAADKYVQTGDAANEGRVRNNLAVTLRQLGRLDETRQEIRRAIECDAQFGHASEPWKSWDILADIETDAGNPAAAAEAKQRALECYLAYRRDGGENHSGSGRLAFDVTQALLAGDRAQAAELLQQVAGDPDLPAWLRPFVQALQTIVKGSRDRGLADAPDLHYTMAAEILVLIETLEKAGGGAS